MRRLFLAFGAVGLCVGLACAVESTPPASASSLVEQLGADRYADRETATTALENLGAQALDALRIGAQSENPEIRDRASILLGKMRRSGESTLRLTPKRVKLDYKDTPLGTAINDLKSRTGLNLTLDPNRIENPLRRVTCETAELPVWEALEVFCVAAGLRETLSAELDQVKPTGPRRGYTPPPPPPNADAIPVVLIDGKPEKLAGSRATAVRVVALPPSFPGHKVSLGTGEITLCLDVTPYPGLGWQEIAGVKITRLIDSAGRLGSAGIEKNVMPMNDPNGNVVFARPGVAIRFDARGDFILPDTIPNPRVLLVPLKIATASATSLKRLEGSVFGELLVPNQPLIVVSDLKKNANVAHNGPGELRFTVLEVKEAPGPGGLGMVRVQLESPSIYSVNARRRGWNAGWPEAPRNISQGNRVEAFDAAGKPFPFTGSGSNDTSDDGINSIQTLQYSFRPNLGLPTKLVVVGTKSVTVEVPFVLENVLLP